MAWAMRQRSVSSPRSSNATCRFPALRSPTGFIMRHAARPEVHAKKSEHAVVSINTFMGELPRSGVVHFVPTLEEVFGAIIDVPIDGPIGLQPGAIAEVSHARRC